MDPGELLLTIPSPPYCKALRKKAQSMSPVLVVAGMSTAACNGITMVWQVRGLGHMDLDHMDLDMVV